MARKVNWVLTLVMSILFGGLGIDRFIMGKVGTGILKLLITLVTFGFLGWIWWLIDIILIVGLIIFVFAAYTALQAVNSEGTGPLSDEVAILMAQIPGVVTSLQRIDMMSLQAGDIRVSWSLPLTDGGSVVTGYKVYVDTILVYDGSDQSTVTQYTIPNLSVGKTYSVAVSALNKVGESPKSSLSLVAASMPKKMQPVFYKWLFAGNRFHLRYFSLMMGKNKIAGASMNIILLAKVFFRYCSILNMPSWPSTPKPGIFP